MNIVPLVATNPSDPNSVRRVVPGERPTCFAPVERSRRRAAAESRAEVEPVEEENTRSNGEPQWLKVSAIESDMTQPEETSTLSSGTRFGWHRARTTPRSRPSGR